MKFHKPESLIRNYAEVRVDFSLRREVFFVVIGAIIGAVLMIVPWVMFDMIIGIPYDLSWIAFGHVLGVYSSESIVAGIAIHLVTSISIGIVVGIFLYKSGILNISKLSNGIIYGLLAGLAVFVVFFLPVYQFILIPNIADTILTTEPNAIQLQSNYLLADNYDIIILGSLVNHLFFGITLGIISYLLSAKFGSRYRCSNCDISFSRIDTYQRHSLLVHSEKPIQLKRILILGGGFAGVRVLLDLQKEFQNDISVDITMVSRDNFFLFTPMLPEVSSGAIETNHIVTPLRAFCNRAKFYEANVESIDLDNGKVVITHAIGKVTDNPGWRSHELKYDYLAISIGNETNFFGLEGLAKYAFTIKSLGDVVALRNHVINMLEQADVEHEDTKLTKDLMTFVVVGGGFSGVETVGELNDFVRQSIKRFYHNLSENCVRVILVSAIPRILPEVTEDLAEFALQKLRNNGIEVILKTRLVKAAPTEVALSNGSAIRSYTLVWAGGGKPNELISNLDCEHDKTGRLLTNEYLQLVMYENVYSLGDCASIIDSKTGMPCPPTAQHAIRQGKVVAQNLVNAIKRQASGDSKKQIFAYRTKGVMTLIGRRNGVGILFGHRMHGFLAWVIWRFYYLSNLPTVQKKVQVMVDWLIELLFKRDVTRVKTSSEEESFEYKYTLTKSKIS